MSEKPELFNSEVTTKDMFVDLKKFENHCLNNDINMEEYFPTFFKTLKTLEREKIRIQLENNKGKTKRELIKELRNSI